MQRCEKKCIFGNSLTYMQARDFISHSFPYVFSSLPQTGNQIIGQIVVHFVLRACVVVIGSHVVARKKYKQNVYYSIFFNIHDGFTCDFETMHV